MRLVDSEDECGGCAQGCGYTEGREGGCGEGDEPAKMRM